MGFADKVEERRRQKASPAAQTTAAGPPPRLQRVRPGQRTQISPLFIAIAAGAVLIPVAQKLGWIDKLLEKLPFGQQGKGGAKGGRSRFRFPAGKPQAQGSGGGGASGSASQKGAKQPAVSASSSLPRNKQSNNKKNKQRRAEKREEREKKRDDVAAGAASGTPGGPGTLPVTDGKGNKVIPLNNVPKDEEILGGAEGKTFTTHSRFKARLFSAPQCGRCGARTSEMYARIRDERGDV